MFDQLARSLVQRQRPAQTGGFLRTRQRQIAEDDGMTDDLNPDGTPRNRVDMQEWGTAVTGTAGPLDRAPVADGYGSIRDLLARYQQAGPGRPQVFVDPRRRKTQST